VYTGVRSRRFRAESRMMVHLTSSLVNGFPLWNVKPLRKPTAATGVAGAAGGRVAELCVGADAWEAASVVIEAVEMIRPNAELRVNRVSGRRCPTATDQHARQLPI